MSKPLKTSTALQTINGGQVINRSRLGGGLSTVPPLLDDSSSCGKHAMRNRSFRCASSHSSWAYHWLIGSLDMRLWANISSIETTSNESLIEVQALLSCRSNVNVARSFQGNEARTFIDHLDRVNKLHRGAPPASTTVGGERRFFPGYPLMRNSSNEVYCCSPRSAKPAASYQSPRFLNGRSYASGGFVTAAGSRTRVMENARSSSSPSTPNISRRAIVIPTGYSRYL